MFNRQFPTQLKKIHNESKPQTAVNCAVAVGLSWLTYEPISALLQLKDEGPTDEIVSITTGVITFVILSTTRIFPTACESVATYKRGRKIGAGSGAVTGIGTGGVLVGADLFTTGGLLTSGFLLTKLVVIGGGAILGAITGDTIAKQKMKKVCENPDHAQRHEGKCCERICKECGFLFAPNQSLKEVINKDTGKALPSTLSWHQIASILHYRGLNYVEIVAVAERNSDLWGIKTLPKGEEPIIMRDCFLEWLENNERTLHEYYGKKPSDRFWKITEKVIRSDCVPNSEIKINDLNWKRSFK